MADKRKYHVGVREVHISTMEIEAESAEQATELVRGGDGSQVMCEYSWTMDPDTWTVEEAPSESAPPSTPPVVLMEKPWG